MTLQTGSAMITDDTLDALAHVHMRSVDALAGYDKMVETAEPGFRPVAEAFRALHAKQSESLARMLLAHGRSPDADGSFMGSVNRAVVGLRAWFDKIDEDVLNAVHSGEKNVLDAYDDVLAQTLDASDRTALTGMRSDVSALLAANPVQR